MIFNAIKKPKEVQKTLELIYLADKTIYLLITYLFYQRLNDNKIKIQSLNVLDSIKKFKSLKEEETPFLPDKIKNCIFMIDLEQATNLNSFIELF